MFAVMSMIVLPSVAVVTFGEAFPLAALDDVEELAWSPFRALLCLGRHAACGKMDPRPARKRTLEEMDERILRLRRIYSTRRFECEKHIIT